MILINKKAFLFLILSSLILFIIETPIFLFANEKKMGNEQFSQGNYAKAILYYLNELSDKDEGGSLSRIRKNDV
jgi:hypothetical protein